MAKKSKKSTKTRAKCTRGSMRKEEIALLGGALRVRVRHCIGKRGQIIVKSSRLVKGKAGKGVRATAPGWVAKHKSRPRGYDALEQEALRYGHREPASYERAEHQYPFYD